MSYNNSNNRGRGGNKRRGSDSFGRGRGGGSRGGRGGYGGGGNSSYKQQRTDNYKNGGGYQQYDDKAQQQDYYQQQHQPYNQNQQYDQNQQYNQQNYYQDPSQSYDYQQGVNGPPLPGPDQYNQIPPPPPQQGYDQYQPPYGDYPPTNQPPMSAEGAPQGTVAPPLPLPGSAGDPGSAPTSATERVSNGFNNQQFTPQGTPIPHDVAQNSTPQQQGVPPSDQQQQHLNTENRWNVIPLQGSGFTDPPPLNPSVPGTTPSSSFSAASGQFPEFFPDLPPDLAPKPIYDDLLRKFKTLSENHKELFKKHNKAKEALTRDRASFEKKTKMLEAKIKKLSNDARKVESTTMEDGEQEVEVEVDHPQSKSTPDKSHFNLAAVKSERDVYKQNANKLAGDVARLNRERSLAYEKLEKTNEELSELKEKYLALEAEHLATSSKLEDMKKKDDDDMESVAGDHIQSDDDEDGNIYKRKEYYKNKYTKLLEQKDKEQEKFMRINQKLLEKYVLV